MGPPLPPIPSPKPHHSNPHRITGPPQIRQYPSLLFLRRQSLIWREQNAQWAKVADFHHHNASVNIVSWSPHESGCLLACASSDGRVSVLEFNEGNWGHVMFDAHGAGVNAVSWAPAMVPGSLVSSKPELGAQRRFATGGSDCLVKIWDWRYVAGCPLLCTSEVREAHIRDDKAKNRIPTHKLSNSKATKTGFET